MHRSKLPQVFSLIFLFFTIGSVIFLSAQRFFSIQKIVCVVETPDGHQNCSDDTQKTLDQYIGKSLFFTLPAKIADEVKNHDSALTLFQVKKSLPGSMTFIFRLTPQAYAIENDSGSAFIVNSLGI